MQLVMELNAVHAQLVDSVSEGDRILIKKIHLLNLFKVNTQTDGRLRHRWVRRKSQAMKCVVRAEERLGNKYLHVLMSNDFRFVVVVVVVFIGSFVCLFVFCFLCVCFFFTNQPGTLHTSSSVREKVFRLLFSWPLSLSSRAVVSSLSNSQYVVLQVKCVSCK